MGVVRREDCLMDTHERETLQLHLEPCGSLRLGIVVESF